MVWQMDREAAVSGCPAEELSELQEDAYDMIAVMSHTEEFMQLKSRFKKGDKVDMCTAMRALQERQLQAGIDIGIEQGIEQFILDNLETLRKNGRLSKVKAFVASTLNIKPVMGADKGEILQRSQGIGMKKAMAKMAELIVAELKDSHLKKIVITHCNAMERAEKMKKLLAEKLAGIEIMILDTAGISSMYANDGGIIVAV